MNKLTPIEIEKHDFKTAWRGYDTDEVRAFLSQISHELTTILREFHVLQDQYQEQKHRLSQVNTYEDQLRDTLLTATQVGDMAKENAQRESELIIKEAEVRADEILSDARIERRQLTEQIQTLKRQRSRLSIELRSLVESHLRMLDNQEMLLQERETDWKGELWENNDLLPSANDQKKSKQDHTLVEAQELTVTLSHDLTQDLQDTTLVEESKSVDTQTFNSKPKEKSKTSPLTHHKKLERKLPSLSSLSPVQEHKKKDDEDGKEEETNAGSDHSGMAMLQEVLSHTPQRISHLNISTKAPSMIPHEDFDDDQ